MKTARPLLAVLLATPLVGCDAEGPRDADYQAVGHIDISAVRSSPWLKDKLDDGALDDGHLGACADLLKKADAVTFGGGEGKFEAYIEGSFDASSANACADFIDAEAAKREGKRGDDHPRPEAVLLSDDVFAVFGGGVTPSLAGLESLLAADPSRGKPMWLTAIADGKDDPIDGVTVWADPRKGFDAHVSVKFDDTAEAMEVYGQAMLGLTAMRMSGEVGELASAVELKNAGDTMTVDVHATAEQMTELMKKHTERAGVHVRAHHGHHDMPHDVPEGSLQIRIGSSD